MNHAVAALVETCRQRVPAAVLGDPSLLTSELVAPILAELRKVGKADVGVLEPWHWSNEGAGAGAVAGSAASAAGGPARGGWLDASLNSLLSSPPPAAPRSVLSREAPGTYYFDIANTALFSIGVFVLGPHNYIPLHDHPNMCVLSKVLWGSLDVRSYDWADWTRLDANRKAGGVARVVDDEVTYSEGMIKLLLPNKGGNLHSFRAANAAPVGVAVLDVILPPYDEAGGRACSYYRVQPHVEPGKVTLLKGEPPEDFEVVNLN